MKTFENHYSYREESSPYVFYSSFNKSSEMAFICFETEIASKRKIVHLRKGSSLSFLERENELSCQIIPTALLLPFKCWQPGLHRWPDFLRANFRRVFEPRQRKRSFLVSIRSN